jgi:hypothetical protein
MNERIKELHDKVLAESENMRWNIEDAEKFAELIIREYSYDCMDVTSNSEHIRFVAKKWGVEI